MSGFCDRGCLSSKDRHISVQGAVIRCALTVMDGNANGERRLSICVARRGSLHVDRGLYRFRRVGKAGED